VNVNGLDLSLETHHANDLQSIAEACVTLTLAVGAFPFGSLWPSFRAIDGLDIHAQNRLSFYQFTQNFPMLPPSPVPPMLPRSSKYFAPPKSSREILAEERLKEELLEEAVAKLAAEAQAEKNQLKLEEGRQAVQSFENENGSDNSDDDKRGSSRDRDKAASKRRMTKRRDNVTRMTMGVNAEQILKMQITAAVCGVPTRKSRIDHVTPEPPLRRGGKLRLDTYDRVRIDDAPVLPLVARTDLATLRPVSCVWPGINSSAMDTVKRVMTFNDFPAQKVPPIPTAAGHALYLNSAGQFAVRSAGGGAVVDDPVERPVTSWSSSTLKYGERRLKMTEGKEESQALIRCGQDIDTTVVWNGIIINAYLPCMGVYGHLKLGKKKKQEVISDYESVKGSEADVTLQGSFEL
jgi:hypothetical protein